MRLIDADKLIGEIVGESPWELNSDFDGDTRRKILKYINNAPTEMPIGPLKEALKNASTEFYGEKFLSLFQVGEIILEWYHGKTK